jgi:hypothetical protein
MENPIMEAWWKQHVAIMRDLMKKVQALRSVRNDLTEEDVLGHLQSHASAFARDPRGWLDQWIVLALHKKPLPFDGPPPELGGKVI